MRDHDEASRGKVESPQDLGSLPPGDVRDLDPVPPSDLSPVTESPRYRGRERARHLWEQGRGALVSQRDILLVIVAGGVLGSLCRWGIGRALPRSPTGFPWATFIVNVSGCFLIGILMVFVLDVWPPSRLVRPFLGVGFLGGYTTFSTYMLDTRALLVADRRVTAGVYLFGSLAAGFFGVWVATAGTRSIVQIMRQRAFRRHDGDAG
jgi:fluoride exporter